MKAIIVMSGDNNPAKTEFTKIAMYNRNLWCWSINPNNVVGVAVRVVAGDGKRDKKYYEAVKEFREYANKNYDFDRRYINEKIDSFRKDPKTQLLLIHGIDETLSKEIRNKNDDVFALHFVNKMPEVETNGYDKIFVLDENFETSAISALNIMTQDLENFVEENN
jgi:hypothetical protein